MDEGMLMNELPIITGVPSAVILKSEGGTHRTRSESGNGNLLQRANSDRVQNLGQIGFHIWVHHSSWVIICLSSWGLCLGVWNPVKSWSLQGQLGLALEQKAPPYGCPGSTVYMNLDQPLSADRGLESSWGGAETSWGCLCLSLAINPLTLARHSWPRWRWICDYKDTLDQTVTAHCFLKVPGRQKAQRATLLASQWPHQQAFLGCFRGVGRMGLQGNKMAQQQRGVLPSLMIWVRCLDLYGGDLPEVVLWPPQL